MNAGAIISTVYWGLAIIVGLMLGAFMADFLYGADGAIQPVQAELSGETCETTGRGTAVTTAAETYAKAVNDDFEWVEDGVTVGGDLNLVSMGGGLYGDGVNTVFNWGTAAIDCGSSAVSAVAYAEASGTPTAGNIGFTASKTNIYQDASLIEIPQLIFSWGISILPIGLIFGFIWMKYGRRIRGFGRII